MHLIRRRLASGIDPLERKHLGGCADTRIAGKAPPGRMPKSGDTLHTIRREEPGDQGSAVEASESIYEPSIGRRLLPSPKWGSHPTPKKVKNVSARLGKRNQARQQIYGTKT